MVRFTLPSLSVICLLSLILGPFHTAHAIDTILSNAPLEIGTAIKEHVVPFKLASVPNNAELRLQFGVIRQGSCPKTYEDTTVRVNNELVASLDFRDYKIDAVKDIRVSIPEGILVAGENQLKIRTGSCKFDIDVMRLDNLTIVVQK